MVTGILELFFGTITWVWNFTGNFTGIVKVYECNFDQSDGWIPQVRYIIVFIRSREGYNCAIARGVPPMIVFN